MILQRHRARASPRAIKLGAAVVTTVTLLCAGQEAAAAAFTTTARGTAVALSAIVPIGKSPTATVDRQSVRLDWAPSTYASGKEVSGYILRRQALGSTDVVQICAVASPMRTCQDSPPPQQQVVYTVVPTEQLWRGPASPPSAPVSVSQPSLAVASTPSPSSSPSPTPTPSPSPAAAPSPSTTPSPSGTSSSTPTTTPSPSPSPS